MLCNLSCVARWQSVKTMCTRPFQELTSLRKQSNAIFKFHQRLWRRVVSFTVQQMRLYHCFYCICFALYSVWARVRFKSRVALNNSARPPRVLFASSTWQTGRSDDWTTLNASVRSGSWSQAAHSKLFCFHYFMTLKKAWIINLAEWLTADCWRVHWAVCSPCRAVNPRIPASVVNLRWFDGFRKMFPAHDELKCLSPCWSWIIS